MTTHEPSRELTWAQLQQWQDTYRTHPGLYGPQPSAAAIRAVEIFRATGAHEIMELGAGQGRDALYFASRGFTVHASDFSEIGLAQLRESAQAAGLDDRVRTIVHDAREPLPMPDASVDAAYAHMLLCMALSTHDIQTLVGEVRRILRVGGTFTYTARHAGDAHYGIGKEHGDDIYEHGGFAVHFFPRWLVDVLAEGWNLIEGTPFEEGALPRRLWQVVQTLPT